MTIIYSGFDTIVFAVKGALSPNAIERMEQAKAYADKERRDVPYPMKDESHPATISPNGRTGGYAFVLSTGPLGQLIAFKKNISRTEWNGHVKIRALALAAHGWKKAVDEAFHTLERMEFHVSEISLNRVDYCMDFLNTSMTLDPRDFVAHSRVKKSVHCKGLSREKPSTFTCKSTIADQPHVTAVMRSDAFEGITIGKMPGRQIAVYDKRREVLDKRNFAWFRIWGVDRYDHTQSVRRIELRAGKNELLKYSLRTFEDFHTCIGDLFIKTAQSVRMIDPKSTDSNISRKPCHPTWLHVQSHVKERLLDHVSQVSRGQILGVIRKAKAREYMGQIRGNAAGYAVCQGIDFQHISEFLPDIIGSDLQDASINPEGQFQKTYVRARDRLKFLSD